MFWEAKRYFERNPKLGFLLSPMLSYLRLWDFAAAQRVDYFIANSRYTAARIKKYYQRRASVVYPFVDLKQFRQETGDIRKGSTHDFFLVVTRLVPWKRVDIAICAAGMVGASVKIVGDGPDRRRLEGLAAKQASRLVTFLGCVSDKELVDLYRGCRGLVMTQEEDFGITSLEAQAMGKPVIAYGSGGTLETVIAGETGEFFYPQTAEALAKVLRSFDHQEYSPAVCRKNAEQFSKEEFKKKFKGEVERLVFGVC